MKNNIWLLTNPLEQFEIFSIINGIGSMGIGSYSIIKLTVTNMAFYLIGVIIVFIFFHVLSNSNTKYGSGGLISGSKYSIVQEFISNEFILSLTKVNIGKGYEKYYPFILTLFYFVLFNNLIGMVPYSFTPTSHFALTIGLSVIIMIGVTLLGLSIHGIKFFSLFVPVGTPLMLVPLLTMIELLSYLARSVSLGLRLGANLLAGHTLLKIISTFSYKFVASLSNIVFVLIGVIAPLMFLIALSLLELGVAFLQSYVFAILTCFYLKDALHLH